MPRFQPMLGCQIDLNRLQFPVIGSPKLDGWRCINHSDYPYPLTRTLLPVPNRFVKTQFAVARLYHSFHGLDGELIVGPPNAQDVWNQTQSGLSSSSGEPAFTYWVFDDWAAQGGFVQRNACVNHRVAAMQERVPWIKILEQRTLSSLEDLLAFEEECLALGFEGIVVRNPHSPYKFGRAVMSPLNRQTKLPEQGLVKVKRTGDFEIEITEVLQRRVNLNPSETDGRGYAKRGHSQEGMIPVSDLGKIVGHALNGPFKGALITASPGKITEVYRKSLWNQRADLPGQLATITYTVPGSGELPRSPRFKGIRAREDFDATCA